MKKLLSSISSELKDEVTQNGKLSNSELVLIMMKRLESLEETINKSKDSFSQCGAIHAALEEEKGVPSVSQD